MESHNQPSKIARLSDHAEMKTMEGSSQNGLGLSLGLNRVSGRRHGCSKSSGFTFLQLRELEHQALIYNYIEAGIPVPFHLILPVWKSVASSFTGLNSLYTMTTKTAWSQNQGGAEEQMGRNGGAAKKLFLITSTVRDM
ncbi:growth-regulating factor 10-like isoform X3 [Rhododendron vialii]|uniref:growth-regulating factor 10-like isoform X3 n=1 Tax=Rhododendron vialii TaxID=182163 RepID=UPI00265E5CD6|nr:growth-regulating factor 10-like isoform X3 [Rhododendron vialii]